jgi:hypothetical protein
LITLKNQRKQVADEILKNINNNYLQGLALTDLLDAENASTQAQNNYCCNFRLQT